MMGYRYLVTGAQLGTLITLCKMNPKEANKLINKIIRKQQTWESDSCLNDDIVFIHDLMHKDKEE